MKKSKNILIVEEFLNFLIDKYNFKIQKFEDTGYALYVKFVSPKAGIYFTYEFRDFIPQIQFSIIGTEELTIRPGISTIKELYKDHNYKLKSFFLDEILLFKGNDNYKKYFQEIKTIEDGIRISSELIKEFAIDYLEGNEVSYYMIDKWFRKQALNSFTDATSPSI